MSSHSHLSCSGMPKTSQEMAINNISTSMSAAIEMTSRVDELQLELNAEFKVGNFYFSQMHSAVSSLLEKLNLE